MKENSQDQKIELRGKQQCLGDMQMIILVMSTDSFIYKHNMLYQSEMQDG